MLSFFNNSLHHPTASHPRDGPTKLHSALRGCMEWWWAHHHTCVLRAPRRKGERGKPPLPPIGQAGKRGRPMRERKEGENGLAREETEKEGDFLSFNAPKQTSTAIAAAQKPRCSFERSSQGVASKHMSFSPPREPKFSRSPSSSLFFCPKPDTKHVRAPTPPTQA